jgi:hypothetical protein
MVIILHTIQFMSTAMYCGPLVMPTPGGLDSFGPNLAQYFPLKLLLLLLLLFLTTL